MECYKAEAALIAPAALNMEGSEMTIFTGYFHSMNLAQPMEMSEVFW
jgi:hypothetical protein